MTKQFREGEEVEVLISPTKHGFWREAKIVRAWLDNDEDTRGVPNRYVVQFPDGSRGVYSEDNIRTEIEWPQKWAQLAVSP